jgi:hypothetical protein
MIRTAFRELAFDNDISAISVAKLLELPLRRCDEKTVSA